MGLNISEIRSSVKVPGYDVGNLFLPINGPILDVVTKLNTSGGLGIIEDGVLSRERERVKFEIEHLIVSDGLSLRKLDLNLLRNSYTLKGSGKVSVKNKKSDIPEIASDFTDLGLEAVGFPIVKTIFKIGKTLLQKTPLTGNMTHSSPFSANLYLGEENIGMSSSVTHKWNKYRYQGDEEKFGDIHDISGLPVLRNTSEVQLTDIGNNQLAARLNIPLFGLSRDHAKDTVLRIYSIVSQIDEGGRRERVTLRQSERNLGKLKYREVQS